MYKYLFLMSIMVISIVPFFPTFSAYSYQNPIVIKGFHKVGTLGQNQEVIVSIYLPLRNLGLLYYYASAVSNPNSPLYHKFLTKQQIEQMFLPVNEYENVLTYLKKNGFDILFTALDSVIVVKGTVGQVETYLGTNFALYSNGSVTYYTNYGQPKIDAFVYSSNISAIFFSHPTTLVTENDLTKLQEYTQQVNSTFPIEAYWPTALQKVYNTTAIPSQGENTTIGILDFYGDPYIVQQLAYFDKIVGLPNPPNFTVIPIGPYNPNLGILTGWAGEISLDVEVAHAIAPKANIILYIANPNLPLSSIIAYIVSQDNVDTLSQSFSIPEYAFSSFFNGEAFYVCVGLTDQYYALGSAEGITFLASSGDAGGAGYSNGPIGTVGYPSTSPFVTAVGGTTTYIQFPNGSYYQTAWSNYGFVPNGVNYGGSTGGVSIIEPKPWYQWGLPTPASYPNGKLIPEISANANVYPGIYIVFPGNTTGITGGTSEASPIVAGLVALIDSYAHTRIGLLNPILTFMYENYYGKAIEPVTFGYNIPWTVSYGYNLVTGYGTINAGYFANLLPKTTEGKSLSIVVNVYNSSIPTTPAIQFYPNQQILVVANITYNGNIVNNGIFVAVVENYLGNLTEFRLTYNPITKVWSGYGVLPKDANGIIFVYVIGNSNGITGVGYYEAFSGYYVQFLQPITFLPIYTELGNVNLSVSVTNIYGQYPLGFTNLSFSIYSYNINNNEYTLVTNLSIIAINGVGYATLPIDLPVGDLLIEGVNAYGFDAFTNGIYMQSLFIKPQVFAEPGSVSPGQYIIIMGSVIPPYNLPPFTFSNVMDGTNITAELVSPSGKVVSQANILLNPITLQYQGYLYVPKGVSNGLYTILLYANYNSYTLDTSIQGFYYGQIYVASQSVIKVTSVKYAFEGQTVKIYANITNGTSEITYGMYSATVYPNSLSSEYSTISSIVNIPLWYNPEIHEWEGNFTLPSEINAGNLSYLAGLGYYGEPFRILITGVSALGNPTTTNNASAYTLYVLPYTYISNETLSDPLTYYAALVNLNLVNMNNNLINDFLINDTIVNSNLRIASSNLTNVIIKDSNVSLSLSNAENITLYNSTLYILGGSINGLKLINSKVIPVNTYLENIYPSLPIIIILKPNASLTGIANISFKVLGEDISEIKVYLNNNLINTMMGNGTFSISINTTKYADGGYNLTIVAVQNDGLSSSNSTMLYFTNNIVNLKNYVNNLNSSISSQISTINNKLANQNASLNSLALNQKSEFDYIMATLVLAIIAIIIGIVGLIMRRR
ncbi:MAG: protease pro-enzyme activation domain-containing protein [Saccharolobus sp.]